MPMIPETTPPEIAAVSVSFPLPSIQSENLLLRHLYNYYILYLLYKLLKQVRTVSVIICMAELGKELTVW